jgi:hypothetical protein
LNTVKTYGLDGGPHGNSQDGLERWWRHVIGGVAAARFHRPDSGHGLDEAAKASLAAARKIESLVKFWDVEPALPLLSDRSANEAFAAAAPGRAYLVYFTNGGSVGLDLGKHAGPYTLRWMDLAKGDWASSSPLEGGKVVTLASPSPGGWVAVIVAAD